MRHIRELLRLKFENGLPGRMIAASLGLSKGAVHDYLGRLAAAGLSWPLPEDLTDTALERRLFPGPPSAGSAGRPEPNWAYVDAELRRKGVTRALLWQAYRADHPEGYGYSWFCEHFDAWKGRVSATMRQRHGAGEKVFVDYAGDTIDIFDPATGAARSMKLFVAAMRASSYIYAEARPGEGLADWIGYSGLEVPLSVSARELQADVQAGRLPDHLPTDAAYDGSDPRLAQTYEQSWRAVSLIASRYGAAALLRLYRDLGRDGRAGALDRVLHRDLSLSPAGLTQAWREQLQRELG